MNVTKKQYIELVSSGAVPVPKTKKDFILILNKFGSMTGEITIDEDIGKTEKSIDDLVLKLIRTHKRNGYLSYVKKEAKRRKTMQSALDKNENAFNESVGRLVKCGEVSISECGKRYIIA